MATRKLTGTLVMLSFLVGSVAVLHLEGYHLTLQVFFSVVVSHVILLLIWVNSHKLFLGWTMPVWLLFCDTFCLAWIDGHFIKFPIVSWFFILTMPTMTRFFYQSWLRDRDKV